MTASSVDAVVIGGGMAGVSLAYELAADRTVALVEMENTLGFHATGRSMAMFLETYGGADVRALTSSSRAFLSQPPSGFAGSVMSPRPFVQIAVSGRGSRIRQLFDEVGGTGSGIELLSEAQVRDVCPLVRPGAVEIGLVESQACELDVHALHLGYVKGLRARGAQIRTSGRVASMEFRSGKWHVRSGDDVFSAPLVVNAAGAWADSVAVSASVAPIGLTPRRRTVFVVPVDGAPPGTGTRAPMLYDVDETFYLKPEGARMVCSPADRTPCEPCDAKPDEVEIARALERVREVTVLDARTVRSAWAGLRTFSPDGNLVIGHDAHAEGFFWFAGQGGYGIQTAPAAARLAASMIRGHDVPADVRDHGFDVTRVAPQRFPRR